MLGVGLGSTLFYRVNMYIKKHWYLILPCILAVLSALDLIFTLIIIDLGRGTEKNPIMRYLMEEHGYVTTSVVKLIVTGVCSSISVAGIKQFTLVISKKSS